MARSIDDLELWMKAYINEGKPWNLIQLLCQCLGVMFPLKIGDLTVAIIRDDGLVRVSPPIRRALNTVVEKLKGCRCKR